MGDNGVRDWLRRFAAPAATLALTGCVEAQSAITGTGGLGEQLQDFAADVVRHLFAAWLF
jgi:hypothetical protein